MPKFTVAVIRIGYACHDMEVEAANEEEAKEVALDHAGGESFSEHHSEYKVDYVTPMYVTPMSEEQRRDEKRGLYPDKEDPAN